MVSIGSLTALTAFTKEHRAQHCRGPSRSFLSRVVAQEPRRYSRTSHEYIWDMLRWYSSKDNEGEASDSANELFVHELFGIDRALSRVVEYFKAASAGSDVGRRLYCCWARRPGVSPHW